MSAVAGLNQGGKERRKPYRVAELAELWDLDASTVYRMIYSGRLHAERHGPRGGALRVPVAAVAEYLRHVAAQAVA
jgi:excisionase family DNA binding protein